jgi:predicted enzyme related to lactoylglutathione lyase
VNHYGTLKETKHKEFAMASGISLIVYPVMDLPKAKQIYTQLLGVEPYVDAPYYVGYKFGDQEIGLDPNGHKSGLTGPVAYRQVEDIHQSVQRLLDVGAQILQEVKDVGGGLLVAILKDADNNAIGLRQ